MKIQPIARLSGVSLALAAAGLVGCSTIENEAPATAAATVAGSTDLVHCYGVNQCNGHNDCKTAGNSCKGQAACNGQGFVAMPAAACENVGGNTQDNWRGSIATADLVHCHGVNKCNGHNDCKTAENSCKGQASCKGHGFVTTSAKSCADIGGKVGT
ncbi:MAG: BufA2 family periplasmic bufferin-type metallophore [Pseudomonadales bacterium]